MIKILYGDAIEQMRTLPPESVHCTITSPPYWGLRDYGVPGQIGLEKTPEEYVVKMMEVFREVRRVLRKDGTLWLNLGDSYGGGNGGNATNSAKQKSNAGTWIEPRKGNMPKQLVGVPWRVAFALQSDGWYLRQDIIWHKPNPMPESVTDRCTKSHEYVFLLTKSAKYYYDAEAIKEDSVDDESYEGRRFRNPDHRKTGLTPQHNYKGIGKTYPKRNKRSVWTINTSPCKEAHFATFPPDLVRPCIRAGTSERGCCPKCRSPWKRVVEEQKSDPIEIYTGQAQKDYSSAKAQNPSDTKRRILESMRTEIKTTGWQPTCKCNAGEPISCTVMDPFAGAFTTSLVAEEEGRNSIGIELNPSYITIGKRRTSQRGLFCK